MGASGDGSQGLLAAGQSLAFADRMQQTLIDSIKASSAYRQLVTSRRRFRLANNPLHYHHSFWRDIEEDGNRARRLHMSPASH
jgi:hypothetical protein